MHAVLYKALLQTTRLQAPVLLQALKNKLLLEGLIKSRWTSQQSLAKLKRSRSLRTTHAGTVYTEVRAGLKGRFVDSQALLDLSRHEPAR